MMNSRRIAARWAAEHPDATAELAVITDGRTGRSSNLHVWLADKGRIARFESWSVFNTSNGICQVCGQMFLETVLRLGWAADPDAGALLPAELAWMDGRRLRAADAFVRACPACVERHGLTVDSAHRAQVDGWIGNCYYETRRHPTLCRFERARRIEIDERPQATPVYRAAEAAC